MTRLRPGQARTLAKKATTSARRDLTDLRASIVELAQAQSEAVRLSASLELVGIKPGAGFEDSLKGAATIQQFVLLCVRAIKERDEANASEMGDLLDRARKLVGDLPDPSERKILDVVKEATLAISAVAERANRMTDRVQQHLNELAELATA